MSDLHRRPGWVTQWRKEEDSAIWDVPPLFYKVWRWILINVDWETGTLTATSTHIADRVQYRENNRSRIPMRATIVRILRWLEAQSMIELKVSGSRNAKYFDLSVVNWDTYNLSDKELVTPKIRQKNANCTIFKKLNKYTIHTDESATVENDYPIAEVTTTKDNSTPLDRTNAELLDPTPEFLDAEPDLFAFYLSEKHRYHRNRLIDTISRRAIYVLHCDPAISPRLSTGDIRSIIGQWMKSNIPARPALLFAIDERQHLPNWEVSLQIAQYNAEKEQTNGQNKRMGKGIRQPSYDELFAERTTDAEPEGDL
jgi:hypothetical protein